MGGRFQGARVAAPDGRLQALPQLVASEIRLALAQQERHRANAPAAAPAPAGPSTLMVALTAGVVVLLGVVVVLALQLAR